MYIGLWAVHMWAFERVLDLDLNVVWVGREGFGLIKLLKKIWRANPVTHGLTRHNPRAKWAGPVQPTY